MSKQLHWVYAGREMNGMHAHGCAWGYMCMADDGNAWPLRVLSSPPLSPLRRLPRHPFPALSLQIPSPPRHTPTLHWLCPLAESLRSCPRVTRHCSVLRHTCASLATENGVSLLSPPKVALRHTACSSKPKPRPSTSSTLKRKASSGDDIRCHDSNAACDPLAE